MNNIVTKSGKMLFTLSECKAYIDKLESADVYPMKHGHWIPQGDDMWLCSNCKENIIFSIHESDRTEKQRYCCKCGARMDLDDTDGYTVKCGKWEQGKCTNCKKSVEDLFSGDFYWDDDDLHYCPNCGARMDGE